MQIVPESALIHGFDASSYQTITDAESIANAGYRFAIIKSTESTTFIDPTCISKAESLEHAGIAVFFYYMPHASDNPNEVYAFMKKHTPEGQDELDLEIPNNLTWPELADLSQRYLSMEPHGFIYSNLNWLANMGYHAWPAQYLPPNHDLWLAWPGGTQPLPYTASLWQYGQGTIPGIEGITDLNYYMNGEASFKDWTQTSYAHPQSPPPTHPGPVTFTVKYPVLGIWDTTNNEYVRLLQHLLTWHGLPLPVTGIFDTVTHTNLLTFQRMSNIPTTGQTDLPTWEHLCASL